MAVNNKRDFLKLLGALGLGALGGALTSDVVYRLSEHSVKFQGTLPGYSVSIAERYYDYPRYLFIARAIQSYECSFWFSISGSNPGECGRAVA